MNTVYARALSADLLPKETIESQQLRIAFLYVPDERPVFRDPQQLFAWMQSFSELDVLCRGTVFYVQPPKQNNAFEILLEICENITNLYDQFDGFVVVFSRDQVLNAGAVLSLLITQTGKPVVCTSDYATGIQTRFRDYYSTALKGDLVNTAHVAGSNIGTVITMAGVEILHPALAKVSYNEDRPFLTSATNKLLGVVDFGIRMYSRVPKRSGIDFIYERWNFEAVQRILIDERKLAVVKQKDFALRPGVRGLVAEVSGVAPLSLLAALPKDVPVLITSQAGVQLSISGTVLQLKVPYTHQALVAQFARAIAQQKEQAALSLTEIIAVMQQQKFPTLNAGV